MSGIDFGYASRTLRSRAWSLRVPIRGAVVASALCLAAACCAVAAICLGDFPLAPGDVLDAFTGRAAPFHRTIVLEWRLPVAIAALLFGGLLGIGGAIFQSLTRNPLGSPDVIGFDAGSYTAVVVSILLLGSGGYWAIAAASLVGGLGAALVVYLLAYRSGVQGFRLIIVGIALSAMLGSVNAYLITRADLTDAITVGFWGAGSIGRVTWASLIPSIVVGAVIAVAAAMLAPSLRRLELGDDAAIMLGTRPVRSRLGLIVVGVAAVAVVTAAAGPIAFVALVAPQLARRLARTPGAGLPSSAAMGAALLAAAHLVSLVIAQLYRPVPVGIVTVCLGGIYLIRLLVREARKHSGVVR